MGIFTDGCVRAPSACEVSVSMEIVMANNSNVSGLSYLCWNQSTGPFSSFEPSLVGNFSPRLSFLSGVSCTTQVTSLYNVLSLAMVIIQSTQGTFRPVEAQTFNTFSTEVVLSLLFSFYHPSCSLVLSFFHPLLRLFHEPSPPRQRHRPARHKNWPMD